MTWWKRALVLLTVMAAVVVGLQRVRDGLVQQGRDDMRHQINEGANERIREALRAGGQQAQLAQQDARAARQFALALQQELRHDKTPLAATVAAPPEGVSPGADAPGAPATVASPAPGGGIRLTGRAVRLWDSALAGQPVPAGACGADDQAPGACAAATDYTLDDAISNHIENAALCREDRARHARLIDYLQQRQAKH